jgi:hypothetical protein
MKKTTVLCATVVFFTSAMGVPTVIGHNHWAESELSSVQYLDIDHIDLGSYMVQKGMRHGIDSQTSDRGEWSREEYYQTSADEGDSPRHGIPAIPNLLKTFGDSQYLMISTSVEFSDQLDKTVVFPLTEMDTDVEGQLLQIVQTSNPWHFSKIVLLEKEDKADISSSSIYIQTLPYDHNTYLLPIEREISVNELKGVDLGPNMSFVDMLAILDWSADTEDYKLAIPEVNWPYGTQGYVIPLFEDETDGSLGIVVFKIPDAILNP